MSEILNLSSLCRCCHADGNFRSLGFAYNGDDGFEVYAKMIQETFKIMLNPPPIDASYAICEECVSKLRDAYRFKLQVLSCEEKFHVYCQNELALANVAVKMEYEGELGHEFKIAIDETLLRYDDDNYNEEGLNDIDTIDEEPNHEDEEPKSKENENSIDNANARAEFPPKPPKAVKTAVKQKVSIPKRPVGRPKKKKVGRPKKVRVPVETRKSIDKAEPLHVTCCDVTVPTHVTVPLNDVTVPLNDVTVPLNDDDIKIDMKVKEEEDEASEVPKIENVPHEAPPQEQEMEKVTEYKCNYDGCGKVFFKIKLLNTHRKAIHSDCTLEKDVPTIGKSKIACEVKGCQTVCKTQRGLDRHRRLVHSSKPLKDPIDDIIRSVSPISEVIKTETGDLIACLTCGHTFQNNEKLNIHLYKEHGGTMKCPKCKKFYRDKYSLRFHISKVHLKSDSENFKCEICEKEFKNKYAFRAHENIHTKKRIYICDLCNMESVYKASFIKHIKSHYGTLKKFYCEKCGRGCNDQTNLRIHIQTVHEKLRNFECHICGKKFALRKSLKAHLLRHQGIKINKIYVKRNVPFDKKCKICFEPFVDRLKYRTHVRKHKMTEKKFKCDFCDSKFLSKYCLKRHLVTHSGEKKFSCPFCPAHFTQKCKIPLHVRNVHNKPNFEKTKCLVCNRFVIDMEKHMKGHEIKPFACDMCDKKYPVKNALNRHIAAIHSGKSKHECNICNKSYIDLSKLRTHIKKKHSIEEPKVEIDNYDAALPSYAIQKIVPYSVDIEKI